VFSSFFSSKNQKLVKQWTKEHEQIIALSANVKEAYRINKFVTAKKELKKLRKLTLNHLMSEDNELYKLSETLQETDEEITGLIHSFSESFHDTKPALIHFLKEYANDEAVLDDNFLKTLNKLHVAFSKRVIYEEKTLFSRLSAS